MQAVLGNCLTYFPLEDSAKICIVSASFCWEFAVLLFPSWLRSPDWEESSSQVKSKIMTTFIKVFATMFSFVYSLVHSPIEKRPFKGSLSPCSLSSDFSLPPIGALSVTRSSVSSSVLVSSPAWLKDTPWSYNCLYAYHFPPPLDLHCYTEDSSRNCSETSVTI
jgi:hypothetical protein